MKSILVLLAVVLLMASCSYDEHVAWQQNEGTVRTVARTDFTHPYGAVVVETSYGYLLIFDRTCNDPIQFYVGQPAKFQYRWVEHGRGGAWNCFEFRSVVARL